MTLHIHRYCLFKNENNEVNFKINIDNDDMLPVSYVIEDTLKLY